MSGTREQIADEFRRRMTPAEHKAAALLKGSLYGYPDGRWNDVLLDRCRRVLERTLYVVWDWNEVEIYARYAEGRETVYGRDVGYEIFGVLREYL